MVEEEAGGWPETFADFSRLKTPYPYVLMLPQARILELVTGEARSYPNFRLVLRVPVLRDVPARLISYGAWPVYPRKSKNVEASVKAWRDR